MPSTDRRSVLHVVASFSEKDGGPARYISDLCGELAERGNAINLLTAMPIAGPLMPINAKVRVTAMPDRVVWLPAHSPGCEARRQLGAGHGTLVTLRSPE